MSNFKKLKSDVYSTTSSVVGAISTYANVVEKSGTYINSWMDKQLEIQEAGKEASIENALALQAEEHKQERKDLFIQSQKSQAKFLEAVRENKSKLRALKEDFTEEELADIAHLL